MAKSNFNYYYNTLPNLFWMDFEDILEAAWDQYPGDDNEEKRDQYVDDLCDGARVLDYEEIQDLKQLIKDANEKIQDKGHKLYYYSNRQKDQDEGYMLKDFEIFIEPGEYQGYQLAVSKDYKYLNKTNRQLVKNCLIYIAKKLKLWGYTLAYRFSNGETGFSKVKEY